jgi:hypothetical protein
MASSVPDGILRRPRTTPRDVLTSSLSTNSEKTLPEEDQSHCTLPPFCNLHVHETFLRYVLRYLLRYNLGKKLETSKDKLRTHLKIRPDDIFRISKLGRPNYFRTLLLYGVV